MMVTRTDVLRCFVSQQLSTALTLSNALSHAGPGEPLDVIHIPNNRSALSLSAQVALGSGAARGAASGRVASGGAEPGGAESEGAETGGAEPRGGAASSGGSAGASPRLSPQQLREWFVQPARLRSGATGAGGAGAARAGSAGVAAGTSVTGGTAATRLGGARTRGTGAAGTGGVESGATGADGSSAGGTRAGGDGVRGTGAGALELEALVLEELEELKLLTLMALCGRDRTSFPCFSTFLLTSPLPAPSPYTEQSGGLTERREPASRPVSPIRTARRVPRLRPPTVPGTHAMTIRPSFVPLRVPLPAPPESSLPEVPDPESDRARDASPTVSRLLATAVTDPSFESAAASALVAELLDFAATCCLDYASALVAESGSASPPSV
ncbi:unnamed protein product [Closterium sp. NIES-54]